MKKTLVTLVAMALLLWTASSVQAQYVETFDTGNANWQYGYGSNWMSPQISAPWVASGGNLGGHISGASSNLYAIWTFDTANDYNNLAGLTMTIDTMVSNQETGSAQFYVGRSGSFYVNGIWDVGSDTSWTTHTTVLDAANFTAWPGATLTLAEVLADPDDIGIFFGGTVVAGAGNVLVDNFGTVVVPEPVSSTLFLVGAATLGFRRLRRNRKG